MIQNPINPILTNKDRVQLIYQAVITLEAQTWANRSKQDSFNTAINILDAVEDAISEKYPESNEGDCNAH